VPAPAAQQPGAGVVAGRAPEQGGAADAVGQRRGERRHELGLRRGEAGAPGLAQQRERAPRAARAGEDHPHLVVEAARPPQLTVAGAPVQLTCRRLGQSGRGQRAAGQVRELVDVGFPDLDLREADVGARRERVLHDIAGGEEGGGVQGEQARAVERNGSAQDPGHLVGELRHARDAVDEPDHLVADTLPFAGGGHGPTIRPRRARLR
jgi:hypothetical protein